MLPMLQDIYSSLPEVLRVSDTILHPFNQHFTECLIPASFDAEDSVQNWLNWTLP